MFVLPLVMFSCGKKSATSATSSRYNSPDNSEKAFTLTFDLQEAGMRSHRDLRWSEVIHIQAHGPSALLSRHLGNTSAHLSVELQARLWGKSRCLGVSGP